MGRGRGLAVATLTLGTCASLFGCSTNGGEPSGADTAATSTSRDPIPPIRDPRELRFQSPCGLLTGQQLAVNRIDQPGRPENVLNVPGCEWRDSAYTREVKLYANIGPDVLRNIYARRSTFAVFELTEVAGHPAIRTKDTVDGTSCYFRVAAAQRQTFTLRFTSLRHGAEEPCGPAAALAAAVVGNLPPLRG